MSLNLNKPKERVLITLAVIACIIILVLATCFIKNKILVNKIHQNIEQGSTSLALGKISEAKKSFQQAISLQTENKETYIFIKDEYLKSRRLDDALSILKKGKNNDITGLDGFIKDIKQTFEVPNLKVLVYQNETYSFPKKVMIKINNEDINLPVKWKDEKIDTNKLGDIVFEGTTEEYERSVKLTVHIISKIVSIKEINTYIIQGQEYTLPLRVTATLSNQTYKQVDVKWSPNKVNIGTVGVQSFIGIVQDYKKQISMQVIVNPKPIIKSKQIGYISNVYEASGKRYLSFDYVQFLTGNAAIEAGKKDGTAIYENGKYYVEDDYTIVNNNKGIKNYVIADNASLNVLGCWIDNYNGDINNHSISYTTFKSVSNSLNGHMLCYIYTKNDIVVKVEGQYTP